MIGALVFLLAIPVEATVVQATSHGKNNPQLVPNCLTLRSSQATVVAGGSGLILFSCGGSAALTVGKSERFRPDRKSTRLNSSHSSISYAVFCLKKKKII